MPWSGPLGGQIIFQWAYPLLADLEQGDYSCTRQPSFATPASIHWSAICLIWVRICITVEETRRKHLPFLSFHSSHATIRANREIFATRSTCITNFRWSSGCIGPSNAALEKFLCTVNWSNKNSSLDNGTEVFLLFTADLYFWSLERTTYAWSVAVFY